MTSFVQILQMLDTKVRTLNVLVGTINLERQETVWKSFPLEGAPSVDLSKGVIGFQFKTDERVHSAEISFDRIGHATVVTTPGATIFRSQIVYFTDDLQEDDAKELVRHKLGEALNVFIKNLQGFQSTLISQ